MTAFLMIFRGFPTTLQRFPRIFQNCSEARRAFPGHFRSENFQRLQKTFGEDLKMFRRYTNEFKYALTTSFSGSLTLPPPGASEERPWLGLVTCYCGNCKHQGGVLCNQAVCRIESCRAVTAITRDV